MHHRRPKEPSDTRLPPDRTPVEPSADTGTVEALDDHIATLKKMVEKAEALAGQYRERAQGERQRRVAELARANAERETSEAERARAEGLAGQIRELLVERNVAAGKSAELTQRVEELRRIVHSLVNRPPRWRRLVG